MLLKGEESWAYLVGDAALGITCFRNDRTGCTLELPKGTSTGSFTFRESDAATAQKCWLRDLSLQPSKFLSSSYTMKMLTTGEGERFPDMAQDLVEGMDEYGDYPLRGFAEWRVCSRCGHVLLEGRWGVRVWLVHDGFLVASDTVNRGLLVRRGQIRCATSDEVKRIIDWHSLAPWIPTEDDTSALSEKTRLEDGATDRQDISDALTDADLERMQRWLPPDDVATREKPSQAPPRTPQKHTAAPPQTPALRDQNASDALDQMEAASSPSTAVSKFERIFPAGKRRASTNTVKGEAETAALLQSLQRLCRDGVISVEQLEQLSAKARAEEWHDLLTQLAPYARTHALQHFVAFRTTVLAQLVEARREAEGRWELAHASAYAKHEEEAQHLVGELLFAERMKKQLFPEDVQEEEEEEQEEVSLKLKHMRDDIRKARLKVEAHAKAFQEAEEKRAGEEKREREEQERRMGAEAGRIAAAEADLQRTPRQRHHTARAARLKEMSAMLQRPRAVREHRRQMESVVAVSSECGVKGRVLEKGYKLLRVADGQAMLDAARPRNWGEDPEVTAPERRKSFVIAEHGELVGGSKAKVTLPTLNVDQAVNYNQQRDLKKRLAALEHAKLLRGTRKLSKHAPRPADVMDMLLAQRVQQERDARHEVRGVIVAPSPQRVTQHPGHSRPPSSSSRLPSISRPSSAASLSLLSADDRRFLLSEQLSQTLGSEAGGEEEDSASQLPGISLSTIRGASRARSVSLEETRDDGEETRDDGEETRDDGEGYAGREDEGCAAKEKLAAHTAREVKRRRAVRDATLEMERAVGAVQRREHVHEGFDFGRATRVVHQLVRRHMPHLPSVWSHTWDLSNAFLDALSALPSPRRRPVWRAVCEVDAVVATVMRHKQATLLQCAYRRWVAKETLRQKRRQRFQAMILLVQCNMRMWLARRAIPKRQREIADAIAAEKAAAERRRHVERIGELPLKEAMELPEEDKVVWIQLKVDVTEALIKRLLKLCDGDVGRALMLAQNAKRRAESKKQLV